MFFDIHYSPFLVAESLRGVLAAQFLDEGVSVPADLLREFDHVDSLQDDIVRLHRVGAREWRTARKAKQKNVKPRFM